jgi:hypothetical protein
VSPSGVFSFNPLALLFQGESIIAPIQSYKAGNPTLALLKFDGNSWFTATEAPLETDIYEMSFAATPSNIYVSGRFHQFEGVAANGIIRWDREAWKALGSGLQDPYDVFPYYFGPYIRIAAGDEAVYTTGSFNSAGEKPAENFAIWHETAPLSFASWSVSNGVGRFVVRGKRGQAVEIQVSADAKNWSTLKGGELADGTLEFEESAQSQNAVRFYRVREVGSK